MTDQSTKQPLSDERLTQDPLDHLTSLVRALQPDVNELSETLDIPVTLLCSVSFHVGSERRDRLTSTFDLSVHFSEYDCVLLSPPGSDAPATEYELYKHVFYYGRRYLRACIGERAILSSAEFGGVQ